MDPKTGKVLPDGEIGELVITTLRKEGAPLVRYRTHDLSRIIPGECECGSPFPRIDTLIGRTDDMVKVKGVNILPCPDRRDHQVHRWRFFGIPGHDRPS